MRRNKVMMLRAQEVTGQQRQKQVYLTYDSQASAPPAPVCTDKLSSLAEIMAFHDEQEKEQARSLSPAPVKVQIKNTFIQVDVRQSPEMPSAPPCVTAPAVLQGDHFQELLQAGQAREAGWSIAASPPTSANARQQPPTQDSVHFENDASSGSLKKPYPMDPSTGASSDVSMNGTQAHAIGQCTPCAYFWYKKDGCRLGEECKFCHLCQKGEIKKRKKVRIQQLKAVGAYIPGYAKLQHEMVNSQGRDAIAC